MDFLVPAGRTTGSHILFFFLKEALKNIFIYLFLEGKGRRKRGREEEKH